MKRIFLCVMLILSLVCALPVQAALLEGNTVRWTYIYPEQGTILDTRDVVVGAGTEITNWHDYFSVNFSDTNIYIPYTWPDWYDISWDDVCWQIGSFDFDFSFGQGPADQGLPVPSRTGTHRIGERP